MYSGFLLYATFHDCDPLTTNRAKSKEQLLPLLVVSILKNTPELLGLFISGIFSAALSSLLSCLNSLSAIVLEDFVKPKFARKVSDKLSGIILRSTDIFFGILSYGLVHVVQLLGSVLQLSISVIGASLGNLFGMFPIGLDLPWIGKRATFYGAFAALLTMMSCVFKAQLDIAQGITRFETKTTSIKGCDYNFTIAATTIEEILQEKHFYHISYLYYSPVGAILRCLCASLFSLIFGFEDANKILDFWLHLCGNILEREFNRASLMRLMARKP
jgi:solute carrier family 5 (sodium-coupled monocarboxylate transporter), member 8/12